MNLVREELAEHQELLGPAGWYSGSPRADPHEPMRCSSVECVS